MLIQLNVFRVTVIVFLKTCLFELYCQTTLHTFPLYQRGKKQFFTLCGAKVTLLSQSRWISRRRILSGKFFGERWNDHFWTTALIIGQTDNEWWCWMLCNFYLRNDGCRVYGFSHARSVRVKRWEMRASIFPLFVIVCLMHSLLPVGLLCRMENVLWRHTSWQERKRWKFKESESLFKVGERKQCARMCMCVMWMSNMRSEIWLPTWGG